MLKDLSKMGPDEIALHAEASKALVKLTGFLSQDFMREVAAGNINDDGDSILILEGHSLKFPLKFQVHLVYNKPQRSGMPSDN